MADALTVPVAVAALVLCVAGIAKLRAPHTAASALRMPAGLVRSFAVYELALGAGTLLTGATWAAGLLAVTYGGLSALTVTLSRAKASCGCFGEGDAPASPAQSALSAILGLVALAAAVAGVHGAGWIAGRAPQTAIVLTLGVVAAAYGTVVAYTEIPAAWRAWSAP